MRDEMTLGCAPANEVCFQVGDPRAFKECQIWRQQLERAFPIPDGAFAKYRVRSFPHDFGTYYEVVIVFDDSDEYAVKFAYLVEDNAPVSWDEIARQERQALKKKQ